MDSSGGFFIFLVSSVLDLVLVRRVIFDLWKSKVTNFCVLYQKPVLIPLSLHFCSTATKITFHILGLEVERSSVE